jgi:outer membrane protein TolC
LRDAARTSYDAAFDAYRHGVGTYTDVATEQTSLARADADVSDAHANAFTAAAALALATGALR